MEATKITVDDLEALAQSISDKRSEIDELQIFKRRKDGELEALETRMMLLLEKAGKADYHAECGTIYVSARESVKTPKTPEDKAMLFDYLRQKDCFYEYASVNSQSLNSLYKEQKKLAEERGEYGFQLPGVGEPTVDFTLGFRKKK